MYDTTKPYNAEIKRLIQTTWNTKYVRVDKHGTRKKPHAPKGPAWRHVDGIGTKGEDHWRQRTFGAAVQDVLAMNLNDFARDRCIPFEVCDHIFLPTDDHGAMVEIVSELADQCVVHGLAITGGEPAIHEGSGGLEISMTMLGVRRSFEPNLFYDGDVLIGIGSSGAHSNGFTKIHHVFGAWESLPEDITTPTFIYYHVIDKIDRMYGINGMVHITGGAFTKIKEYLGGHDAYIHRLHTLVPHNIFRELYVKAISDKEMYKTFNCGIGFVIAVDPSVASQCLRVIRNCFPADVIGRVVRGSGRVYVQSMFSDEIVIF